MFTGAANSTNFDEQEDGELKGSPSENAETNVIITAETLKGTEIHIDDGLYMIDRTESIEMIEETSCYTSAGESDWLLKIRRSMLNGAEQEPKVEEDEPPTKRAKICCFNCGGDHPLAKCSDPRDFQRIKQAANDFKEKKRLNELNPRYHQEDTPAKGSDFRPGRISNTLRHALGIGPDDIPEWIYRMRKMGFINGYPPGYLKQAVEKESRDDETLQFYLVEDEVKEGDEEKNRYNAPPKLNERKMIYYMGFNKTYRQLIDREKNFRVPPFDQFCKFHQDQLMDKYWAERKSEKKRRQKEKATRNKNSKELEEDGDIVVLNPQSADGDDDCQIIIDRNPTTEGPAEPPLETNEIVDAEVTSIPLENNEESKPVTNGNQNATIFSVSLGAPILFGINENGVLDNAIPSLEAFRKGITPFEAKEEPSPHRGFLKKIFAKIKSVTGTSKK